MAFKIYNFAGKRTCVCVDTWLKAYQAELLRVGEIKHALDVYQLIGAYSKSGGTHLPSGAADIGQYSTRALTIARNMGGAGWHRTPAQGFIHHQHLILKGCPHNTGGRYQIAALEAGYNGLGYAGHGGHDDGPRTGIKFPLRTWEQGIEWANARKPVSMRTTRFKVYEQNCRSDSSGFPTRAPLINKRIRAFAPHFVSAVELYTAPRLLLSPLLRSRFTMQSNSHGKVQYLVNNKAGWKKAHAEHYDLGNGKDAIAVHYKHRATGAEIVKVTAHLSWEHNAAAHRTAEAKRLVAFLKRDFHGLPWLITGDMNDSHKSITTRKKDSSGDVFKAAGLHDLYYDVEHNNLKVNREYNTANGNKVPAPKDGVHIDRYWGTHEFTGLSWLCDVVEGKRPSDHWGTGMTIDVKHPRK